MSPTYDQLYAAWQEFSDVLLLNKGALLLALLALAYLYWWARECRCEKCAFHQNEARMKRLKEQDDEHNHTHRLYDDCGDKSCPRNGERRRTLDK